MIAERGGLILEIGAGPGGGYMPYILQSDPAARIIVSDLSHTVVEEWKRFLDQTPDPPNLSYAAMDFCDMPFRDSSLDVISDHSGIACCTGERNRALRECYRVLKPSGALFSKNSLIRKEILTSLPTQVQERLREEYPAYLTDFYEDTARAGFRKIDTLLLDVWRSDELDDADGLSALAARFGVTIQVSEYVRICKK